MQRHYQHIGLGAASEAASELEREFDGLGHVSGQGALSIVLVSVFIRMAFLIVSTSVVPFES